MKSFLVLSVLFFTTYSINAQRIIDIEADLVSIGYEGSLTFFKKSDKNSFLAIRVIPKNTSNNEIYLTTTEHRIHQNFPETDSTNFEINNLPNAKPEDYLEYCFNKTYSKKSNLQLYNSNKEVIEVLESVPNQLFTLIIFEKNNKNPDPIWEKKETRFLNYFFIRINKRKTILVFINNANLTFTAGLIMATKQKPLVIVNQYPSSKSTTFKENHLLEKEISDSLLHNKLIDEWASANYSIINGKITDWISHENLLKREFDSVFPHAHFLIGEKGSATYFYNKKLQNITPKNLRAFNLPRNEFRNPFYRGIQVLVGNDVKWLINSGELKDSIQPIYQATCGTGIAIHRIHLKITQDDNYFYLNARQLTKTSTYDEVNFINGNTDYQSVDSSNFGNYLKVRKDGKWGIISFKNNQVEPSDPLQITEILSVDYDTIELTGEFILLKNEDLWGYFQINENLKYSFLKKFNAHFARFTLTNGIKGWLTTDGKEYLDE